MTPDLLAPAVAGMVPLYHPGACVPHLYVAGALRISNKEERFSNDNKELQGDSSNDKKRCSNDQSNTKSDVHSHSTTKKSSIRAVQVITREISS